MADFDKAYKRTGIFEGGYTDEEDDNGNWSGGKVGVGALIGTKYGISAPVLTQYLNKVITAQDMKNLSLDTVKTIYIKSYWNPIRGNEINNQDIANIIYDMAVNSGVGTAIKMAKRVRNYPESTKMDDEFLKLLNQ